MKKKIMLVFGTRPEAIKMAPLYFALKENKNFQLVTCVTGQHRELLYGILNQFGIKTDYDLKAMTSNQTLFSLSSKILLSLSEVYENEAPDVVLVHGDTTTSTISALAAFYKKIPVGHIEAGLRTENIYSPFPEEMNRRLNGKLATFHFTPTQSSQKNLLKEGIIADQIIVTGNTGIDALLLGLNIIETNNDLEEKIRNTLQEMGYDIERLKSRKLILITGHRRENFGESFKEICNAIKELSIIYTDIDFVYPMHLNPNVRKPVVEILGGDKLKNIFLIEPLDYFEFIFLMKNSKLILTDSGGIQEEAPSLGKPVLVMRENTERPEGIEVGTSILVGTQKQKIKETVRNILDNSEVYDSIEKTKNPYGDGMAVKRVLKFLNNKLKQ